MTLKHLHCIINPAAGQDEPILSMINQGFQNSRINWTISVTKRAGDATQQARDAVRQGADAVAAYGGDGTIIEVAKGLLHTSCPLIVLPGGTANVLARDLGYPLSAREVLQLVAKRQLKRQRIDFGTVNDQPFGLGLSLGMMADMVGAVDRELKNRFGLLAYLIGSIQQLSETSQTTYTLNLDGKTHREDGVGLIIANTAQLGMAGLSLVPNVKLNDGKLDVILIRQTDLKLLVQWAKATLTGQKPDGQLAHWQAKEITVTSSLKQTAMCDDVVCRLPKTLTIHTDRRALSLLIPKP